MKKVLILAAIAATTAVSGAAAATISSVGNSIVHADVRDSSGARVGFVLYANDNNSLKVRIAGNDQVLSGGDFYIQPSNGDGDSATVILSN
ncbi:MAG: hypothetical protein AAGH82_04225 [Pseudomonadota bacterium]